MLCLAGTEKMNTDVGTILWLDFLLRVNCHRSLETSSLEQFLLLLERRKICQRSDRQSNAFNVGHEHGQQKSLLVDLVSAI